MKTLSSASWRGDLVIISWGRWIEQRHMITVYCNPDVLHLIPAFSSKEKGAAARAVRSES
jgi:hypothetical protein